jgi:flagellar motor protein MotB
MRTLATTVVAFFVVTGVAYALTAGEYGKRANRICAKTNVRLQALPPPKSAKDIGPLLRRTLKIARPAQTSLEKIPLPRGSKRTTAKQAVKASKQQINLLAATSRKIDGGADALKTIKASQAERVRLSNREAALWRKLAARDCAVNNY